MKNFSWFIVLVITACFELHAQNSEGNPFACLGYKADVYTFGEKKEFHDQSKVVEIGDVLFNTRTNEVVGFLEDKGDSLIVLKPELQSMSIDPHCEKYYSISPYVYCFNNPVNCIDPDGRDVVITGTLSQEALQQLQARAGNSITLVMNDAGQVSYTTNTDKKLRGNAMRMAGMINDNSVTVNIVTTDKNETSDGRLMIGGAFMGNVVTKDADGDIRVNANQEVNPNVLGTADSHTKTPGKMIMHEATEAYADAKISQKLGTGVGRATQVDVDNPSSVYNKAHNRATPQTTVYQTFYDKDGKIITDATQAVRVEWSVTKGVKSRIIQTLP